MTAKKHGDLGLSYLSLSYCLQIVTVAILTLVFAKAGTLSAAESGKVISHGCVDAPLLSYGIYGAIIVLVMVFRPQGLFPEERHKLEYETGVHDQPLQDVTR